MKNISDVKKLLPGFAVAAAGCFMLLFYAPYELYLTNHMEFWYTSGQMLPAALVMLVLGLCGCCVLLWLSLKLGDKLYTAVVALGFAAVLAFYVQGNFMVKNLPGLDGQVVDWGAYPTERLKTIVLWAAMLALAALLLKLLGRKRFQTVAGFACAGLTLMLALTLATLFLTTDEAEKNNLPTATDRDIFTMSSDKNFVIMVLDAIDGEEFEKIVYENHEYRDCFRDFTYYDNAMSGYPFTDLSEALFLTGQWHDGTYSPEEYIKRACEASPLFAGLEQRGYDTGLYITDTFVLQGMDPERFDNLSTDQPAVGSQGFMAKLLLKMAAVKYFPWDLKFFGYDIIGRQNEIKILGSDDGSVYFNWENPAFYSYFRDENPIGLVEGPVAKVYHLDGAHVPLRYDSRLNIVEDATYQSGIEGSIFLFSEYAERLKEAGVYDNTALIVMSDHGWLGTEDDELDTLQQHPIFLVKGFGESHDEMQINNAPVSYAELPEACLELMDGKAGGEIFPWEAGDERERRFLMYEWTDLNRFEEYIQTGQAEDMDSLIPTGKVFEYKG